jgi:hypothetical protein
MENRSLNTITGIIAELHHRTWQARAAASIGRTSKQRTAEAECAALNLEYLAADIKRANERAALSN